MLGRNALAMFPGTNSPDGKAKPFGKSLAATQRVYEVINGSHIA